MSCQLKAVPQDIKCPDPLPGHMPITVMGKVVYQNFAPIGEVIRQDENFVVFRHVTGNRYLNGQEQVLYVARPRVPLTHSGW